MIGLILDFGHGIWTQSFNQFNSKCSLCSYIFFLFFYSHTCHHFCMDMKEDKTSSPQVSIRLYQRTSLSYQWGISDFEQRSQLLLALPLCMKHTSLFHICLFLAGLFNWLNLDWLTGFRYMCGPGLVRFSQPYRLTIINMITASPSSLLPLT